MYDENDFTSESFEPTPADRRDYFEAMVIADLAQLDRGQLEAVIGRAKELLAVEQSPVVASSFNDANMPF